MGHKASRIVKPGKMLVILLSVSLIFFGCSRRHLNKSTADDITKLVPTQQRPVTLQKIAVVDFIDNRPFSEKFSGKRASYDAIMSMATGGLWLMGAGKSQPVGSLDNDVPDIIVKVLMTKGAFPQINRIKGSADIFETSQKAKSLNSNESYILAGRIDRVWGEIGTGEKVGESYYTDFTGTTTTRTYKLTRSDCIADISIKLIESPGGKTVWSKTYNIRENYGKDIDLYWGTKSEMGEKALRSAMVAICLDLANLDLWGNQ